MKNSLMSDYLIYSMINITAYYVIILIDRFSMSIMNNNCHFVYDLSFDSFFRIMNYHRVINS